MAIRNIVDEDKLGRYRGLLRVCQEELKDAASVSPASEQAICEDMIRRITVLETLYLNEKNDPDAHWF